MRQSLFKLKDLPILLTDNFTKDNCYKNTGAYFWCRCNDGVLDIGFEFQYKPIGISYNKTILTENSNVVILFENDDGEQTWFHCQNIDWGDG